MNIAKIVLREIRRISQLLESWSLPTSDCLLRIYNKFQSIFVLQNNRDNGRFVRAVRIEKIIDANRMMMQVYGRDKNSVK